MRRDGGGGDGFKRTSWIQQATRGNHSGTHQQILGKVWGPAHVHDTPYLRVFIGQLRQKIESDPSQPRVILTEPGVGYRIAEA